MRQFNIIYALLPFLLAILSNPTKAQDGTYYVDQDFEAWTSATIKYKLNKKFRLSLNEQLRLKDDASTVDKYFTQLSAKYEVAKNLSLGLGLRFIKENDDQGKIQGYETHFRWQTDIGYKHKIDRFSLKYRLRYQNKEEWNVLTADPKTVLRMKVGTSYNIRKWKLDPDFSAELFNGISNNEGFNKLRLTLGTAYKTKKMGEFGLFYRIEEELVGIVPKTTYIAGFKYEYTLKRSN